MLTICSNGFLIKKYNQITINFKLLQIIYITKNNYKNDKTLQQLNKNQNKPQIFEGSVVVLVLDDVITSGVEHGLKTGNLQLVVQRFGAFVICYNVVCFVVIVI